jgi:uncharacterized protein (DUF58 family)
MSRVLVIVWLIAAIILYMFTGTLYSALLLSAAAVFPCAALVLGAISAKRVCVSLVVPTKIKKGEPTLCTLVLENGSIVPVYHAALTVKVKNNLTSKEQIVPITLSAGPNKKTVYEFAFESASCGQYEFICGQYKIVDFMGLRSIRRNAGIKETRVSMPDTFQTQVFFADADSSLGAGDTSNINKKGPDHNDPLQYRDYVDGDPMNRINYKLSFKYERYMIADGSQPRKGAYLVIWNGGSPPDGASPSVSDALAEAFVSICMFLADAGIPYTAAWQSAETGAVTQMEVASRDELYDVIEGVMRTGGVETQISEYLNALSGTHYPAVAYFSYKAQNELGALGGIGHVMPFLCKGKNEPAEGEGCYFTPENYRSVLSRVYI